MSKNILSKSLGIVSNYKNIKRRYFKEMFRIKAKPNPIFFEFAQKSSYS